MAYDVCKIIQAKFITTKQGLVCLGTALQREGKQCLAQLIDNRGHKSVDEALALAKKLSAAELLLERFKTREYNFYKGPKIVNVFWDGKKWYEVAIRVLENEEIMRSVLFTTVYNDLSKGKGKCRKMHVHGTSDCSKNFMLLPLKVIYETFCNPSTGRSRGQG